MMEVDRVLRPGGYWVLSGPPINYQNNYISWQRPKEDLKKEYDNIVKVAKLLCWEKIHQKGEIGVWQKSQDADSCRSKLEESQATVCKSNPDEVWYASILRYFTRNPSLLFLYPTFVCMSQAFQLLIFGTNI